MITIIYPYIYIHSISILHAALPSILISSRSSTSSEEITNILALVVIEGCRQGAGTPLAG